MPTYQYKCRQCAHPLEAVQSFTDAALTECPVCQGTLRKVFSTVGVVFKGSGFYRNDSRAPESSVNGSKDGKDGKDGTDKSAAAKSDGKSESKSESKSDSTSDSTSTSKSDSTSGTKVDSNSGSAGSSRSESKSPAKSESSTAGKSA